MNKTAIISGTSNGIGKKTAELFLERNWKVAGIDMMPATLVNDNYRHCQLDLRYDKLPALPEADVLVCNAGLQGTENDLEANILPATRLCEALIHTQPAAILFVASASAITGAEFPLYSASKGAVVSYMRNVAIRCAKWGGICNAISPGGVKTELNRPVMEDRQLWEKIMELTPLRRWSEAEEIAEWIWFLTVTNKSMTGENLLIDNGETRLNAEFVWPG